MSSSTIGFNSNYTQSINFKGSETEYSAEIMEHDVTINCSTGDHRNGSSKVKLKNLVDYNWEMKFHIGQLIACHISGKLYAYTLRPKGPYGMFRVVNIETDQRTLVKDLKGSVQDISFALCTQVILGCIDEEGNLFVYSVDGIDSKLSCTLMLHVVHPRTADPHPTNYRVVWCPYMPMFGEDADTLDDPAKMLAVLNGSRAEVWDVSVVTAKYGAGPLQPNVEYEGYVEIDGHSLDLIDASFSPDGTAIATASLDGYVKFFQVYMVEKDERRCLHQWQPHEGKALSSLLFLDNIKACGTESKFWKFAITGARYNAELKIWSCETWTCLQTLSFEPNPHSMISEIFLKVIIDMSADYLLMSDINNKVLYILQIQKHEEGKSARVSTISEFLLPSSIISFGIVNVGPVNLQDSNSNDEMYEENEEFEDESSGSAVAIKLIVVQPKSLQECTITYKPEFSMSSNVKSVYGNVLDAPEAENDFAEKEVAMPELNELQNSVTLLIQHQTSQSLNLMTPDDFNSPVTNVSPNANALTSPAVKKEAPPLIDFEQPQKDNCTSGGSSPSREVQEILALNNAPFSKEYFDKLMKLKDATETQVISEFNGNDSVVTDNIWPDMALVKAMEVEMSRRKPDEEPEKRDSLNARLLSLEAVIKLQSQQVESLQDEIKLLSSRKPTNEYDIRNTFAKELDSALNKHQLHVNKMLDGYMTEQKRREQEQHEKFIAAVTQNMGQQIAEHLQHSLMQDIKTNVVPSIMNIFDKLKLQMGMHYSQKLNGLDQLLKTNIGKLCTDKAITDNLTQSIVTVIKPSLENSYKEMIASELIPSWERVCNTMFQQINDTFTQGTKEYTTSVEMYMERQRKVQDKGKDLINKIQEVSDQMSANADKFANTVNDEINQQIAMSFNGIQEKISTIIADVVREQVTSAFRAHAAHLEDSVVNAVRSRAVTPSPHVIDTLTQIAQLNNLIMKGNINQAFQQALSASASASDLQLVLHVCEMLNPEEIFDNNCPLQQPVLLSLIQQLSADLNTKTEIKLQYLQIAIYNLELNNVVTKEHVPNILKDLSTQLKLFMSVNPKHKSMANIRLLSMLTRTMLSK